MMGMAFERIHHLLGTCYVAHVFFELSGKRKPLS